MILYSEASCNAPPPRSPGAFVYEPVGRDPLGSTKKRIKYTAKRTIVIQTDRCAFKTQNSSLPRPFCSNRLLFGDGGDDGDDGRCGVVDFFIILLSSCHNSTTHSISTRARAHATPYRTTDRTYRRHYLKHVTQTTDSTNHHHQHAARARLSCSPSVPITYRKKLPTTYVRAGILKLWLPAKSVVVVTNKPTTVALIDLSGGIRHGSQKNCHSRHRMLGLAMRHQVSLFTFINQKLFYLHSHPLFFASLNTFKQAKTIVPWIHTKVHVQDDCPLPLPSTIQSVRGPLPSSNLSLAHNNQIIWGSVLMRLGE